MNNDLLSEIKEALQSVYILNVREVKEEKDGIYAICEVANHCCCPYRLYTVNNLYNINTDTSLFVNSFYRYVGDELTELPDTGNLDDTVYSVIYDEVVVKIYDYTKREYEAARISNLLGTIAPGFYLSFGEEIIYEMRGELCNETTEKLLRMNIFTFAEALANKEFKKEEVENYIKLAYLDSMSRIYLNRIYISKDVTCPDGFRSSEDYLTDIFQKVMLLSEYGYPTDNFAALGFMDILVETEIVGQTSNGTFVSEKLLKPHYSGLDSIEKSFKELPKKASPLQLAISAVPGVLFLIFSAALFLIPSVAELFASEISGTIFVVTHIAGTVLLLPFAVFPGVIWYAAFEGIYKILDNKFVINNGTYSRIVIGLVCLIVGTFCTKHWLWLKSYNKNCEAAKKSLTDDCLKKLYLMNDTYELLEKNARRANNDQIAGVIKAYCSFAKSQVDRVRKSILK